MHNLDAHTYMHVQHCTHAHVCGSVGAIRSPAGMWHWHLKCESADFSSCFVAPVNAVPQGFHQLRVLGALGCQELSGLAVSLQPSHPTPHQDIV